MSRCRLNTGCTRGRVGSAILPKVLGFPTWSALSESVVAATSLKPCEVVPHTGPRPPMVFGDHSLCQRARLTSRAKLCSQGRQA